MAALQLIPLVRFPLLVRLVPILKPTFIRLPDLEAELAAFDGFLQSQFFDTGLPCTQAGASAPPSAENPEFVIVQTLLPVVVAIP